MHRFFIEQQQVIVGKEVELPASEVEHIRHSLRLSEGDKIILFNGQQAFTAVLSKVRRQSISALVLGELEEDAADKPQLYLYQGIIRMPQFELVVQKATELGVAQITPLDCEYSQVHFPADSKKYERWERIVREACKQAERTTIPIINPIAKAQTVLTAPATDSLKLFFTLPRQTNSHVEHIAAAELQTAVAAAATIEMAIGPEGGFSKAEHEMALAAGWKLVTLGEMILRSETAAIAALGCVQALAHQ